MTDVQVKIITANPSDSQVVDEFLASITAEDASVELEPFAGAFTV